MMVHKKVDASFYLISYKPKAKSFFVPDKNNCQNLSDTNSRLPTFSYLCREKQKMA